MMALRLLLSSLCPLSHPVLAVTLHAPAPQWERPFPVQPPVPPSPSALLWGRSAPTRPPLWLRVPLAERLRISPGQHHLQRMPDRADHVEYYNPQEHRGRLEPSLSPWRAERVVLENIERAAYCRCTRARQGNGHKRGSREQLSGKTGLRVGEKGERRHCMGGQSKMGMCNVGTRICLWCWAILGEWEEQFPFGV